MRDEALRVADQDGRDLALDVAHSVIVQAPAGSGKTELLTQRILRLLTIVDDPEEVLAITFTRKAAGEMRDRLLKSLRRAANDERPEGEHNRRNWELARAALEADKAHGWHIVEHPARLRIMTIDALNAALTRQMPLLAKVGASLDISSTPELLYREAATSTLELLAAEHPVGEALAILVAHLDNRPDQVIDLIARMLGKREQWLRHVLPAGQSGVSRTVIEKALSAVVQSELEALESLIPADLLQQLVDAGRQSAECLAEAGSENPLAELLDCCELAFAAADLPAWQALVTLMMTGQGTWRRALDKRIGFPPADKVRKADFKDLLARLTATDGLQEALLIVRSLPATTLNASQWEALQALLAILPVAAAQLELTFRRQGKVDYTAISRAALDALGEAQAPSDLALALDYRIQHVLVDEFQDTSASQFELISTLIAGWTPADGRTLFCVGDPMQSIYRFREAEVSLFLRAWREGIGDLPLTRVNLSVNFRSQARVVEWVNHIFPDVMPARADLQTAAVPFTRSDAYIEPIAGEAVSFHPLINLTTEDEADLVAQLVDEHRKDSPDKTIAILVSGRNHLREIMPALRRFGLRPQAVEIEKLDRQSVVHDLIALTRALLHGGDRSAWLAVLRAPWCGLSLTDLHALAGAESGRTIPELLEDPACLGKLSSDGSQRAARLKQALWPVLAWRARASMRDWVDGAWRRLAGPACLTERGDLSNADAFFNLLDTLAEGDALENPLVLNDRLSKLYASVDPEADQNLSVMTVHKAKGLQFDVVIVPGLDRRGRDDDKQLLRWMEIPRAGGGLDLVLSPVAAATEKEDKLDKYLRDLERRRHDLERGRLLYVAVTRARTRVHLLARAHSDEKDGECVLKQPATRSMLETLWAAARPWFESAAAEQTSAALTADATSRAKAMPVYNRLPLDWQKPAVAEAAQIATVLQARTVISEEAVSFDWAGQTARHVGTVVHEALRHAAMAARLRDPDEYAARIRARLQELGTRSSDLEEGVQLAVTALRVTLADERGRWIIAGRHHDARCEFALSSVEQGIVHSVVLDRTFVDQDGVRWIIDYKVGVHEGTDRQAFFDQELGRYRQQLERYAQIISRLDERPLRTALYFPVYAGWREWDPFAAACTRSVPL